MKLLPLFLLIACARTFAQPNTEIYLFDLSEKGISNPVNISNNEGYDNQPSFWPDNESILYARTVNGQTEIARYFIETKKTTLVSDTPEGGEYSPLKIPGKEMISAIRLDTSGLQLLYRYDLSGKWSVAVLDLKIGYHAWVNERQLICFVLGEPATLQLVNTSTGESNILRANIGRSLHKIPNSENISYLDKSVTPWTVNELDLTTKETKEICQIEGSNEDHCWAAAGVIIMGDENRLMNYTIENGWQIFADLTTLGLSGSISRLAVSPNGKRLAVVISP